MHITILQAILIGVLAGLCMAGWLIGIYTATPLIYAFATGIILGDIKTALVVGASAQILWLGFGMGTGGVRPPDPIAPGVLATVMAIINHHGVHGIISLSEASKYVAITFAFGILVQFLLTALLTAMAPLAEWSKKSIEKGHFGMYKIYANLTVIVVIFIGFGLGVASALGGEPLALAMRSFPIWLKSSLKIVGGLLPALGFALILNVMLKKQYIAFIFIGYMLFVIVGVVSAHLFKTPLRYSLMMLTIGALSIALLVVAIEAKIKKAAPPNVDNQGGQNVGI